MKKQWAAAAAIILSVSLPGCSTGPRLEGMVWSQTDPTPKNEAFNCEGEVTNYADYLKAARCGREEDFELGILPSNGDQLLVVRASARDSQPDLSKGMPVWASRDPASNLSDVTVFWTGLRGSGRRVVEPPSFLQKVKEAIFGRDKLSEEEKERLCTALSEPKPSLDSKSAIKLHPSHKVAGLF